MSSNILASELMRQNGGDVNITNNVNNYYMGQQGPNPMMGLLAMTMMANQQQLGIEQTVAQPLQLGGSVMKNVNVNELKEGIIINTYESYVMVTINTYNPDQWRNELFRCDGYEEYILHANIVIVNVNDMHEGGICWTKVYSPHNALATWIRSSIHKTNKVEFALPLNDKYNGLRRCLKHALEINGGTVEFIEELSAPIKGDKFKVDSPNEMKQYKSLFLKKPKFFTNAHDNCFQVRLKGDILILRIIL